MGLAVTKHLLAKNWKVCMTDINKECGDTLAKELGEDVLFIQADVADYEAQARVFETVWTDWKRIDFGIST
jgi:15-hydroxyprostaglandin dehydrogenase (NAD)